MHRSFYTHLYQGLTHTRRAILFPSNRCFHKMIITAQQQSIQQQSIQQQQQQQKQSIQQQQQEEEEEEVVVVEEKETLYEPMNKQGVKYSDTEGDIIKKFTHLSNEYQFPLKVESKEERDRLISVILNFDTRTKIESNKLFFLGQNVLNICCADYLYSHFSNMKKEQLDAVLQQFTRRENILDAARDLKLNTLFLPQEGYMEIEMIDDYIVDSSVKGHEYLVSNTLIRLIGAIYSVSGLYDARQFISSRILSKSVDITTLLESFDPKRDLLEMVKSGEMRDYANEQIVFETVQQVPSSGKKEEDSDLVTVLAKAGDTVIGKGVGFTKKIADMKAAQDALNRYYTKYKKALTPIQLEQRKTTLNRQRVISQTQ
jgi:dsRNA-specific ribonuclease